MVNMVAEISREQVNEAYFDMHRSLIELKDVPSDFTAEPLIIGGDELRRKLDKISPDFGSIGDKLVESDLLSLLDIPEIDNDPDLYDFEKADLEAIILSDKQVHAIGMDLERGSRVGVVESHLNGKRVFFRIPEDDVASLFVKKFKDDSDLRVNVDLVKDKKVLLGEFGIDSLELGRIIYGLWNHSLESDSFYELDELCKEVIMDKIPVEGKNIEEIINYLETSLTAEVDMPADNWWKARLAVKKILGISEGEKIEVETVCEFIEVVSEKAKFYPDAFWKAIVEPLVRSNYGGGKKIIDVLSENEDGAYTGSLRLLRQVESAQILFDK